MPLSVDDRFVFLFHTPEYLIRVIDLEKGELVLSFRRRYERVDYRPVVPKNMPDYPFPKYHNDLCRLLWHDGRLWAVTSTFDKNKGILVDVYSRGGQYLDNFYLPLLKIRRNNPQYYAPMAVRGDFLYVLEADEDDLISLVKYEILGGAPALQEQRPASLFGPRLDLAVGRQPTDVAVGDVNGDGALDMVTANAGSDSVTVLLGDGRGGFRAAPGSPFALGPKPHQIALGDVDRDGRIDLATTEHDSHDVRVFLGRGDGSFAPAAGSPFAALASGRPHNHGVLFVDADGDGSLDIATSNQNDHSVSVLLGDGRGGFRASLGSPFRVGRAPYPLAAADLNGDGKIDLVTPDVGSNTITVLTGAGSGRFGPADGSPYAVAFRPYAVALGDLNGDRRPDIVAAHDDITLLTVLLNDGRGRFRPSPGSPVDIGERGGEVVLADLDRDGRLDLATGTAANHLAVLLGDGAGRFSAAPGSPFAAPPGPWSLAAGDLNRDGKPDLVVTGFEAGSVMVLLGR